MIDDASQWYEAPLLDMGHGNPALRGILAPAGARDAPMHGVTAQFLEHAADYHDRYGNLEHFRILLDNAFARLRPAIAPRRILDVGSGSGNSVVPLLDRFPDACVVATDISAPLLAILRDHLRAEPRYAGRFALVCIDAGSAQFRPASFDLAVGAAILHHVLEPARVIQGCHVALRPGGAAIFLEPFELGHAMAALAYREIVAEAARRSDDALGIGVLRKLDHDYATRLTDPADPRFLDMDDKWMFTRAFFEDLARREHWDACEVYPIHASAAPLTAQTRIHLRLGGDLPPSELPQWAWDHLARCEQSFSPAARAELMFEGAVILGVRPGRPPTRAGWWFDPAAPGRGFFIDRDADTVSVLACHYTAEGAPIWHATGPAPLVDGTLETVACPGALPGRPREAAGQGFRLHFEGESIAHVQWGPETLVLVPQHPTSPGLAGAPGTGLGGWWIEDSRDPSMAFVAEHLGERIFAALLDGAGWAVVVAGQQRADTFGGDWLRFDGGQALGAPYRPPGASTPLGPAMVLSTKTDRAVVQIPDGRHVVFRPVTR